MDNRITKNRLSDFLSYEWILIILFAFISIMAWELFYTMASVKLTTGQQFKFFFDQSLSGNSTAVMRFLDDDDVLSYDVQKVSVERLLSSYNVLSTRLDIQDGDVIFTNCKDPLKNAPNPDEVENTNIRLKEIVDAYCVYSFEELNLDAQEYLKRYIKDENLSNNDLFDKVKTGVLDESKIEKTFRSRMKKDNRFRTQAQIKEGVKMEKERIERLYEETVLFGKLLELESTHEGLFYRYTKYAQRRDTQELVENKERLQEIIDGEVARLEGLGLSGVDNADGDTEFIYALNLGKLPATTVEGKVSPSSVCRLNTSDTADDVCLAVFNFRSYQPHLQFETISFINSIVRNTSDILDGVNIR